MTASLEINSIPQELRTLKRWCVWKYVQRGDSKPTKVPFMVSGNPCSTTDPGTWDNFGAVVECSGYDGIGFVFAEHDPYVGIDLDNSIGHDGRLKPWAKAIVDRFNTYTEISPSGKGVKMWCRGTYPAEGTGKRRAYKDGAIEMYCKGRYFAVTGRTYPNTPPDINGTETQQTAIDGLYHRILNPKPQHAPPRPPATDLTERCIRFIEKIGDAISGQGGHDRTFNAACICFRFGLSDHEAWRVLEWFNANKCQPRWSHRELAHKIESARDRVMRDGEFGKFSRSIDPPRVPIAEPPKQSDALLKLINATITGERVNIAWPWPMLTVMAKALFPGTITVVCGAAGASKSMFINEACLYWLEQNIPFAAFHLEEDRSFHELRALAQLARKGQITDDEWTRENPDEILDAYDAWRPTLERLGQRVWDAPASDVSLRDLEMWVADRAGDGSRIIVIDPVTAADSGREPWLADRRFVLNTKRILRDSGASMVVVTHPRDGNPKHGSRLDNHAGGQAYNRFTQCVLGVTSCSPKEVEIVEYTAAGTHKERVRINRVVSIHKARSGRGTGHDIGYWFDGSSLRFEEQGVICD